MKYPHLLITCMPQRWVVCGQCGILLTVSYMMRFTLSFAITQMTKIYGAKKDPHSCPMPEEEEEMFEGDKMEFKWTSEQQGLVHSGFFWGYLIAQVPGGVLSDIFNHKFILLTGFYGTVAGTLVTPMITRWFDWPGLIGIRIVIGICQGVFYNALHAVAAHWAPPPDRGILGTFIFSGVQIGTALNAIITGYALAYYPWPIVFYAYGILSFFFGVVFLFTTYSYPSQFPKFKDKEKKIFDDYTKSVQQSKKKKIPLWKILTNIRVWAIFLALAGQDWGFYTLVTLIPTYFDSVLFLEIQNNGAFLAALFFLVWVVGLIAALLSDFIQKRNFISLTWNRRIFYLIGTIFPALGFVGISYSECEEVAAISLLIAGASTLGFFYPSVKVNPMDLSPNFAGTVGSIGQMGGCLSGAVLPYVFGALTPNRFKSEWRIYFWLSFAVVLFGGLCFFCLSSAKVQRFNEMGDEIAPTPPPPVKKPRPEPTVN